MFRQNVLGPFRASFLVLLAALLATAGGASAGQPCKQVNGSFTLQPVSGPTCSSPVGICAAGNYKVDIKGTSFFTGSDVISTADTPATGVIVLTGDAVITTDRGTLNTKDAIVLDTTGAGNFAEVDTAVGGTGAYAGTTGQLKATGKFTAAAGGEGSYTGEFCTQ